MLLLHHNLLRTAIIMTTHRPFLLLSVCLVLACLSNVCVVVARPAIAFAALSDTQLDIGIDLPPTLHEPPLPSHIDFKCSLPLRILKATEFPPPPPPSQEDPSMMQEGEEDDVTQQRREVAATNAVLYEFVDVVLEPREQRYTAIYLSGTTYALVRGSWLSVTATPSDWSDALELRPLALDTPEFFADLELRRVTADASSNSIYIAYSRLTKPDSLVLVSIPLDLAQEREARVEFDSAITFEGTSSPLRITAVAFDLSVAAEKRLYGTMEREGSSTIGEPLMVFTMDLNAKSPRVIEYSTYRRHLEYPDTNPVHTVALEFDHEQRTLYAIEIDMLIEIVYAVQLVGQDATLVLQIPCDADGLLISGIAPSTQTLMVKSSSQICFVDLRAMSSNAIDLFKCYHAYPLQWVAMVPFRVPNNDNNTDDVDTIYDVEINDLLPVYPYSMCTLTHLLLHPSCIRCSLIRCSLVLAVHQQIIH